MHFFIFGYLKNNYIKSFYNVKFNTAYTTYKKIK